MKYLYVKKIFYIPLILFITILYLLSTTSNKIFVRHVYKVFPTFFFICNNNKLKLNQQAKCLGIINLISSDSINEEIINHEMVHVKQYYRSCFTKSIPLFLFKNYIAYDEGEAYVIANCKHRDHIPFWADHIIYYYAKTANKKELISYMKMIWDKQHNKQIKHKIFWADKYKLFY